MIAQDPLTTNWDPIASSIHSKDQGPASSVMKYHTSRRYVPMSAPTRRKV